MKTLIYLLQVSACTGVFFLFYKLVLCRYTFFTLNRWYLLATLLFSFVIPAITIPAGSPQPLPVVYKQLVKQDLKNQIIKPVFHRSRVAPVDYFKPVITWADVLPWLYLFASSCFSLQLAIALMKLSFRLRGKKIAIVNGISVIRDDRSFRNSSFMNYIFLNDESLTREELQQVVEHELTHIRLLHSADRIFARLVQIVLWFNPFCYFYSQAIAENHEFEVDQQVTYVSDKNAYAELLLRLSVSTENSLYHHFSMIPLKKRIVMLFNKPTRKMKKIMYLLVLPLGIISCLAFSNREMLLQRHSRSTAKKVKDPGGYLKDETPLYSRAGLKQKDGNLYDKLTVKSNGELSTEQAPGAIGQVDQPDPVSTVTADTLEYKADAYLPRENASLQELLKKLEGITFSDGTILANGKPIKRMLLDGKSIFGGDPNIVAANLPADIIAIIQVIPGNGNGYINLKSKAKK